MGRIIEFSVANGFVEHKIHAPVDGRIFFGKNGLAVSEGTELAAICTPKRCDDNKMKNQ